MISKVNLNIKERGILNVVSFIYTQRKKLSLPHVFFEMTNETISGHYGPNNLRNTNVTCYDITFA